jgi:hypothetical protein
VIDPHPAEPRDSLARLADALERLAAVAERDETRSAVRALARMLPALEADARRQAPPPPERPVRIVR